MIKFFIQHILNKSNDFQVHTISKYGYHNLLSHYNRSIYNNRLSRFELISMLLHDIHHTNKGIVPKYQDKTTYKKYITTIITKLPKIAPMKDYPTTKLRHIITYWSQPYMLSYYDIKPLSIKIYDKIIYNIIQMTYDI